MPPQAQGALERASTARRGVEVPMGEHRLATFQYNTHLFTRNLNSCTAVAIVSPEAALLAHIQPSPRGNIQESNDECQRILQHLVDSHDWYTEWGYYSTTQKYIVAAFDTVNRRHAMPDHINLALHALSKRLGLPVFRKDYDLVYGNRPSGWSSVVIESPGLGHMPVVYLNDVVITPDP